MPSINVRSESFEARRDRVFGPRTDEHRRFREDPGIVAFGETWWRDHYEWLLQAGYTLRPRYNPKWTRPWLGTGRSYEDYEEGQRITYSGNMDATRTSDGSFVSLKLIDPINGRSDLQEVRTNQYLSSEPLASDPRNHCAQISEVIQVPDDENLQVMVMPFLRPFDDPLFATFGEAVAFFSQLFEGLQFLHEHRVAHRDCTHGNIMMDASPMYPHPWHPIKRNKRRDWKGKAKHYTRTERLVKYYYIDFGLSQRYRDTTHPWPPLELPVHGGDKTAPESQEDKYNIPCNPFATDIYYLGNLIRESFMQKYYGFGFMKELVEDMVQDDPSKRPEINEVVTRFAKIRGSLYSWKLRGRTIRRKEWKIVTLWRYPPHIFRTVRLIATRKSANPDP
ncbi:hypothetical protein EVG20_g7534 [Dentipellis fragilis]|uniref:Protein kinase domain-containing protein n=1 Tax=Dentipellis fragilis TaxID=205917 RepID=A0A4Y9YD57_9AGAM|nr:hypothetical protein EVG20_g7534 [Dentipellis fragilis]